MSELTVFDALTIKSLIEAVTTVRESDYKGAIKALPFGSTTEGHLQSYLAILSGNVGKLAETYRRAYCDLPAKHRDTAVQVLSGLDGGAYAKALSLTGYLSVCTLRGMREWLCNQGGAGQRLGDRRPTSGDDADRIDARHQAAFLTQLCELDEDRQWPLGEQITKTLAEAQALVGLYETAGGLSVIHSARIPGISTETASLAQRGQHTIATLLSDQARDDFDTAWATFTSITSPLLPAPRSASGAPTNFTKDQRAAMRYARLKTNGAYLDSLEAVRLSAKNMLDTWKSGVEGILSAGQTEE